MKSVIPIQLYVTCKQRRSAGFSFVELMVSLMLSTIILSAAFVSYNHYRAVLNSQRLLSEIHDNLRTTLTHLSRDLSLTGYGLDMPDSELSNWITWEPTFMSNPQITDGDTEGSPDSIMMAAAYDRAASIATAVSTGATEIVVEAGMGAEFNLTDRKLIYIGRTELARITAIAGDQLTVSAHASSDVPLTYAYPVGAPVELVEVISYSLEPYYEGDDPILLKRFNHQTDTEYWFDSILTPGIEDLQFTQNGNAVNVDVVGRSMTTDRSYTDPDEEDHYRRIEMSTQVLLRNLSY